MPKKSLVALAPKHKNTKIGSVTQYDQASPQLFINLISILDAYLTEGTKPGKPFLVKDNVKIIL